MRERKGDKSLENIRHTLAHLLASAVLENHPKAKLGIGPTIENGFYYDFDLKESLAPEDLPKLEKRMRELIKQDLKVTGSKVTTIAARKLFKDQPYKLDLIKDFVKEKKQLTVYKLGNIFSDLCKGGHVKGTKEIGLDAFKLTHLAGAYWKGDENNAQLQRVYGVAFNTQPELESHMEQLEEAAKRDHRKLGKELDLFSTNMLTGQGLILWHPKLSITRNVVEQFWRDEHYKNNYNLVFTPHIASMDMFVLSRHYNKYIDSMFPAMLHQYIEGESKSDYSTEEQLKPMNCPNHIQIFKSRPRSYRELPLRLGELGTVYRYERAGSLHGMTRVRGFTQDDSHIFCKPDQATDEIRSVIKLSKNIYEIFGFKNIEVYIATRPKRYLGTLNMWSFAENALKKAAESEGLKYQIDEGEGVFYGPKIDLKASDALGRKWQLGTIQFDFNMPDKAATTKQEVDEFWAMKTFRDKFNTKENLKKYLDKLGRGFDVTYINDDGKEERVVMIHRTILGSMERFFGVLIEHYAGAFPLWLSPVQVQVIAVGEKFQSYAQRITQELRAAGMRTELAEANETLGKRIREAETQKIPYILIVGEKEKQAGTVAVRKRGEGDLGTTTTSSLIKSLQEEINKHR